MLRREPTNTTDGFDPVLPAEEAPPLVPQPTLKGRQTLEHCLRAAKIIGRPGYVPQLEAVHTAQAISNCSHVFIAAFLAAVLRKQLERIALLKKTTFPDIACTLDPDWLCHREQARTTGPNLAVGPQQRTIHVVPSKSPDGARRRGTLPHVPERQQGQA